MFKKLFLTLLSFPFLFSLSGQNEGINTSNTGFDIKNDPWQIAPMELIPLMVKGIQDLQAVISKVEAKNKDLENRLLILEKLMNLKN